MFQFLFIAIKGAINLLTYHLSLFYEITYALITVTVLLYIHTCIYVYIHIYIKALPSVYIHIYTPG